MCISQGPRTGEVVDCLVLAEFSQESAIGEAEVHGICADSGWAGSDTWGLAGWSWARMTLAGIPSSHFPTSMFLIIQQAGLGWVTW